MKIGIINIVNSSEYQKILEEKNSLIRANERLHTDIQLLKECLEKSQNKVMENHKIFCYLSNFYYTVQDSMEKIYPTMKEFGERKDGRGLQDTYKKPR